MGRTEYKSPLDPEIIQAWAEGGNDKETEVPKWIRNGAHLASRNPSARAESSHRQDPHALADAELEDAQAQLAKGDISNYKSVSEDLESAYIELDRYKKESYLVELSKDEVIKPMSHGTISRLGLIVKEKPEGVKRRTIIDLRRSGGNAKAHLPEKLALPRPKDALGSARDLHDRRHEGASGSPINMEMVVIDISDAFMSLGVAQQEIPHTLAPHIKDEGYYAFIALVFGYKTAPLLWCRVGSLLARLLQSLVGGHEGQHQMYIDDALWFLQGDLKTRNLVLSMLLTTTAALGFKISVKKHSLLGLGSDSL